MKNVDVALYRAKSAGRGTFALFEPARDDAKSKRQLCDSCTDGEYEFGKTELTALDARIRVQSAIDSLIPIRSEDISVF